MSRRRRRQPKTPSARALEVVEAATMLWLVAGAVSIWPFPVVPSYRPVFFISTVAVVAVWWWAIVVIRKSRTAAKMLDELKAMTPAEFEAWVAARFKDLGYKVKTTAVSGDHGVDLVARRENEKVVIQCNRYCESTVGEPVMRDLYGAMQHESADRAYLVSTSYLTPAALSWSRGKPIEVWNAKYLSSMTAAVSTRIDPPGSRAQPLRPHCPNCEAALIEKHNHPTGEGFLACSNVPRCRYTESLPAAVSRSQSLQPMSAYRTDSGSPDSADALQTICTQDLNQSWPVIRLRFASAATDRPRSVVYPLFLRSFLADLSQKWPNWGQAT